MKNKILTASTCMCVLSLAGLLFLAVYVQTRQYQDLIISVPDGVGFSSIDLKDVNEACNEEIALTYEIKSRVTAEAANFSQPVMMIGTNSKYPEVIGLDVVAGNFLTAEVWTMGNRYAVLNEPAAFKLFGSNDIIGNTIRLDGEIWMVMGIVNDGNGLKDDLIVYVPSSMMSGYPEMLMAKTAGGTGVVSNSMRTLGIYDSGCRVIDISAVSLIFWQLFCVSVYLGTMLLAFLFALKRIAALRADLGVIKVRSQTMYFDQLVMENRGKLGQMTCQGLLAALSGVAFLYLARKILALALAWKDLEKEIKYLSDYFFQGKMQWLMRYLISGPILFTVFAIALLMVMAALFKSYIVTAANESH